MRVENSALAHAISRSDHLIGAALQVMHVLGIILLLASLVLLSLRLLGLALSTHSVTRLGTDAVRLMGLGFAMALVSGVLMFVSSPRLYFYNPAFRLKMLLLLLAIGVHAALLHTVRRDPPSPLLARWSATCSLVLWFAVGFSGRVIGFL
ncbi:MAG: hypothetical protein IRZ28_07170 [Steroidobacteraceae bacterium]|nr:hypothetical protein [Steroidobacteraceae bacterium]